MIASTQAINKRKAKQSIKRPLPQTGPSCSKLTMSLVNVSLNLWSSNMAYALIFLLKNMRVAFAFAKATHIFFSKNTCEFDIVLTGTVNVLTTNELVKLTMLWTTQPRWLQCFLYRRLLTFKFTLLNISFKWRWIFCLKLHSEWYFNEIHVSISIP